MIHCNVVFPISQVALRNLLKIYQAYILLGFFFVVVVVHLFLKQ